MEFKLNRTSDFFYRDERKSIVIDTMDDLKNLWEVQGKHSLIISFGDEPEIEIYDDWRE